MPGNVSLPAAQRHLAAPYNLDAQPLKPDAVALSWMYSAKGLSAALPVTHYTVRCEALESMVLGGHCKGIATQSLILKTRSVAGAVLLWVRERVRTAPGLGNVRRSSGLDRHD